jgi:endo-1,4-beta-xylanase
VTDGKIESKNSKGQADRHVEIWNDPRNGRLEIIRSKRGLAPDVCGDIVFGISTGFRGCRAANHFSLAEGCARLRRPERGRSSALDGVWRAHRIECSPSIPHAVIVIPGGGHSELWMDHEGYNVAKWLSDRGVAAFVLKYRLAREKGSTYTIEGDELQDVKRAIRLVRSRASEWGLDPQRVGVMGFSAGGELAALASTRYDNGVAGATDTIEHESAKPAFQALLYPAIPHDLSLSAETPPAFLACGENDRPDIAQGLPELYLALKRAGVSAELHVFAGAGHGFGLRESNRAPVSEWPQLFLEWLDAQGFLKKK